MVVAKEVKRLNMNYTYIAKLYEDFYLFTFQQ